MQVILGSTTLGPGALNPALYVAGPSNGVQGLHVDDAINQRSTCEFYVVDTAGANHFPQGTGLQIFDDTGLCVYGGFVADSIETHPGMSPSNVLLHHVTGMDYHYLADKRIIATSYTTNQTCGGVAQDLITNWLSSEGVYAVKNLLSANQSDVESGTTGFATTGGGTVTITQDNTHAWHGTYALKTVADGTSGSQGWKIVFPTAGLLGGYQYTFSCYLYGPTGGQQLLLRVQNDSSPFTGYAQTTVTGTGAWQRVSVTFTLPATPPANIDLMCYTNGSLAVTWWSDGLQLEPTVPNCSPMSWELGGTTSIQTGPAIAGTVTYNYKPASYILDQMAQFAQYQWWIDAYRRLWFVASATFSAPFTFDGTQPGTYDGGSGGAGAGVSIEHFNKAYRNSQYVLGAREKTGTNVESHMGDGSATSFTLGYEVNATPTNVNVNGGVASTYSNSVLSLHPLRYYRLDDPSGTTMTDTSGNSQNGTYVASPTLGATGLVTGDSDKAVTLNGTSQYGTFPTTSLPSGAQPWSLVALCKPSSSSPASAGVLLSFGDGGTTLHNANIYQNGGGGWGGGFWVDEITGGTSTAGTIYLVACTYDGTNLRLYVNGALVAGPTPYTGALTGTHAAVGAQWNGSIYTNFFGGTVDEAQVYNVALTANQIARLWNQANTGVSETVGIKGASSGKQWYWAQGDTTLYQDTSGVVLAPTDTLYVTYVGQYAVVAYAQDSSQVTKELALEGIGTGTVEDVQTDTKLTTAAQAFQEASGLLGRYSTPGTILTFKTTRYGLQASQMLTVALPWGASTVSGQFLIEAVRLEYEPNNEVGLWWYTVTATQGPVSDTWVAWFNRIVQPPQSVIDVTSLGVSDQVVLLHQNTVGVSLGGTIKRTTITYSFPSPSSYPSPYTYPGSAGSAVTLTWYKPNAGLNALASALNPGTAGEPAGAYYFAWGTGTQGTPATATQLASEQGRKLVTSYAAGGSVGEELLTGVLSPQDGNGLTITEFGFFAGPNAGSGANTGTLLLYATDSVAKTASVGVNVVADLTFS